MNARLGLPRPRWRTAATIVFLFFVASTLLQLQSSALDQSTRDPDTITEKVNWSDFAYTQYVTNTNYLCNSVMLFETLHRLKSKADRLMLYPDSFSTEQDSLEGSLLRKARDDYGVKLIPVQVQSREGVEFTWKESYTKLLAFNQTQYKRVLHLDSDATILQPMDELFLLPPSPVALPRAYWLGPNDHTLAVHVFLLQPSESEFNRVMAAVSDAGSSEYDMEILNRLYNNTAQILPHRGYALLTGEFRLKSHSDYLGNGVEIFNPEKILQETKYLHFSDWPVPKPWFRANPRNVQRTQPVCDMDPVTGRADCRARDIWLGLYGDFATRRKNVCGLDLEDKKAKTSLNRSRSTVQSAPEFIS
ncbi:nucleotide-diphospho-sugar transferase [Aspergillus granulosus]|uniref:Nucleotide-diphospho-sugar transferase n=1 Tax=Aspergillus granulosus TaxID=176169 RepID=A0ABR4H508_9EURO